MNNKICVIAGAGQLPMEVVKNAVDAGHYVLTAALSNDNFADLKNLSSTIMKLGLGEITKAFTIVQNEEIRDVVFIGKVHKKLLLENPRFDLRSLKFMNNLKKKNDDTIMLGIIEELKKEGVTVLDQTIFLKESLVGKGVLGKYKPNNDVWEDIHIGFETAKGIGRLDVGQTVIVKDKMIMAVEAIEGTDLAIERGCKIAQNNAVIVKVSKPNQDFRFDVPTIGLTTLKGMKQYGGRTLAFEAGKTILVNKIEMIQFADKNKMIVVGV